MMSTRAIVVFALVGCFAAVVASQLTGGLGDEKPADEHLAGIMKQAMSQLETSYPGGFKTIEPLSYRTQVVAGMNYFIKAKVTEQSGAVKHTHLRLYRPFRGGIELHGIKSDVTEKSPLKYFQTA